MKKLRNNLSLFLLSVLLASTSCGLKKNTGEIDRMSTKTIIKNHYKNSFDKNTLSANLKITGNFQDNSQSMNVKIRSEKDKIIWISANYFGFTVAKGIITPTEIKFYEKIAKTYFEGDLSFLKKMIGVELNFKNLENIFFGNAFLNLNDTKYNSIINDGGYLLTPKNSDYLYDTSFLIDPKNFKIKKETIFSSDKKISLTVSYDNYKKIDGEYLPEDISVDLLQEGTSTNLLEIKYKDIKLDKKLTFPFEFPSGYTKIKL